MNPLLVALFAPFYPTRRQIEAALGHDPAKLARLSANLWRLFRAVAVGCLTGWLIVVGLFAALAVATGETVEWRFVRLATALFGTAVMVNYPWAFREQGSRWVRRLALVVGALSATLFVAGFFGLL